CESWPDEPRRCPHGEVGCERELAKRERYATDDSSVDAFVEGDDVGETDRDENSASNGRDNHDDRDGREPPSSGLQDDDANVSWHALRQRGKKGSRGCG